MSPTDQAIGTGDGVTTQFQLKKTYGSSFAPWVREIKKPVDGTVLMAVDGTPLQASDFLVATTTGVITFLEAPAEDVAITAGFEFDVPVRFDTDRLILNLSHIEAGDIPNIPLVEIRL